MVYYLRITFQNEVYNDWVSREVEKTLERHTFVPTGLLSPKVGISAFNQYLTGLNCEAENIYLEAKNHLRFLGITLPSYKMYKDFAQSKTLKDFAAKQFNPSINVRFGTSETLPLICL